jgi:hypothetical protein
VANIHTITGHPSISQVSPIIIPCRIKTSASNMMPSGHASRVRSRQQAVVALDPYPTRVVLRMRVRCSGDTTQQDDSTRRNSHALTICRANSLNCRHFNSIITACGNSTSASMSSV